MQNLVCTEQPQVTGPQVHSNGVLAGSEGELHLERRFALGSQQPTRVARLALMMR